jgi:hypothetical protein
MKPNKKLFIILMLFGILFIVFFAWRNSNITSELKEINRFTKIDLEVNDAYNERGIYILNNEYFLNSFTLIKSENWNNIAEDNALWRPKDKKYIPRISDISAPFRILKNKDSDVLKLLKGNDTIILQITE